MLKVGDNMPFYFKKSAFSPLLTTVVLHLDSIYLGIAYEIRSVFKCLLTHLMHF